jgi:hypothetical protein
VDDVKLPGTTNGKNPFDLNDDNSNNDELGPITYFSWCVGHIYFY